MGLDMVQYKSELVVVDMNTVDGGCTSGEMDTETEEEIMQLG